MPVVREPRKLVGAILRKRFHSQGREPNPVPATRAAAGEAPAFPPGTDQRLIDALRIAMKLELEVDPLHLMGAARMGAVRIITMDMRRCHGAESTLAVEAV